jgi:hypothetical protein
MPAVPRAGAPQDLTGKAAGAGGMGSGRRVIGTGCIGKTGTSMVE